MLACCQIWENFNLPFPKLVEKLQGCLYSHPDSGHLLSSFVCLLPGTFGVYCQTSNHYQNGMRGSYSVRQCGEKAYFPDQQYGTVRTFYIMAEETEWDYAPDRSWESERHNSSGEERYQCCFWDNCFWWFVSGKWDAVNRVALCFGGTLMKDV